MEDATYMISYHAWRCPTAVSKIPQETSMLKLAKVSEDIIRVQGIFEANFSSVSQIGFISSLETVS